MRRARIEEQLAADGLQQYVYVCHRYIYDGTGSEEAALAATRALAEMEAARAARRARIEEQLAAEGLQQYSFLCDAYINRGQGSEEEALQRAREARQAEAAQQARRATLEAALEAEGIAVGGDIAVARGVYRYVDLGAGTLDEGGC